VRLRIIPDFGGILDIGNLKFQNIVLKKMNHASQSPPSGDLGGF
jgi:hypothetical protein